MSFVMFWDIFCCPICKASLSTTDSGFACQVCRRSYDVVDGLPDFFVAESEQEAIDEVNKAWLYPENVEARDVGYRLRTRELKGMAFCMREIGQRTFPGCRLLEVGMGTGHFTVWLAEVVQRGTGIYAFDFSRPILEKAKGNVGELPGVTLFRANACGRLPFKDGFFDIVFLRLAPLGAHGVPNVRAAFELLRPGGWFFEARWRAGKREILQPEWAIQHGYASTEHHTWQYERVVSDEEYAAGLLEERFLISVMEEGKSAQEAMEIVSRMERLTGVGRKMTHESLLIAQKPGHRVGREGEKEEKRG